MHSKTLLRVSIILFWYLIIFSVSFAQIHTEKIIGKVIDDEGIPLPGVRVTLTGENIIPMTTVTDESGGYRFLSFPPGEYSIKVTIEGFQEKVIEGIMVQVGETKSVEVVVASSSLESLDTIINEEMAQVSAGQIMFNPPEEMTKGIRERIEVRISQNINEDLTQRLRGRGVPQVEDIIVSTVMKVKLSGEDFKVESLSEEEQIISSSGFTQWEWDVVPINSGNRLIYLSIAVVIKLDEFGEKTKSYPVMEREIYVKVNYPIDIWNYFKSYWYIILGAIGTLFGIFFGIKNYRAKRKK